MEACTLSYDIPEELKRRTKIALVKDPCPALRRRGFRFNKSCWVLLKNNVPHSLIAMLKREGVKVYLLDFATGQDSVIVQMAIETLRAEVREAIASAQETARTSEQVLQDWDGEPIDAFRRFRAARSAIIRRYRRLFASLREAAQSFGISPDAITDAISGRFNALEAIDAIQAGMFRKSELYAQAAKIIRRKTKNDSDMMAKAIDKDEAPAYVVADYMEEAGADAEEVAAYRLAFGVFGG